MTMAEPLRPLPDVEQFVPRALLEKTLKDMGYKPAKLSVREN